MSDEFVPGDHPGSVMARLDAPTAATETTLAVVADPHVATEAEGTSKIFERTVEHFRNAIADIRERDVDAVLSAGDLTKDGEARNYDAVDEILADLEVPFYGVPGNHDVPKERDEHETMPVSEYASRYSPTGEYPFRVEVGDVDVVGLNTAGSADFLYDSHRGRLDPDRLGAVRETLADADEPIVLSHYNLPAIFDQLREHRDAVEPDMVIPAETADGETYVETLAEGGTSLLLTGHMHMPATAEQGGVREIMTPTTCSFPQGYLTLWIDPDGTTVRFHPVAGRAGVRHSFAERSSDSETARGLNAMAADRLARFPLVHE